MTTLELVCATMLETLQTGTPHFITSTSFDFMIRKHMMLLVQRDIVRFNIILLLNQFNNAFLQCLFVCILVCLFLYLFIFLLI